MNSDYKRTSIVLFTLLVCLRSAVAADARPAAISEGSLQVAVTLDAKSPGRVFEGVGANSSGAQSALLVDYPEPYRSEILDFLFKPRFGAGFQHLKVELGSGMNSTCGAEPSVAITPEELKDPVPRGYEFWLAAEARKRNPDIILDCLPWSTPYWTKDYTTQEAADWVVAFLDVAKKHYGLAFQYVGGCQNEHSGVCGRLDSKETMKFITDYLRPTLDRRGYKDVRIVTSDLCNLHCSKADHWSVLKDVVGHPEFAKAVGAVGYHYPVGYMSLVNDERPLPKGFLATGIPFWASEDFSNHGLHFENGRNYIGKILREYNELRITKSVAWVPFTSLPEGFTWHACGFLDASGCRNGHYEVWPALWCLAHLSQFAEPRWRFIDGAQGRFNPGQNQGQDCYDPEKSGGVYAALRAPDGKDWSLVAVTEKQPVSMDVRVDPSLSQEVVHVWKSDKDEQFVEIDNIKPVRGAFHIRLKGLCIYTLTTTTGQCKGRPKNRVPPPAPANLSWNDDFRDYKRHDKPRYWVDQEGTFEIDVDNGWQVLKQQVPKEGLRWGPMHHGCCSFFGGGNPTRKVEVRTEATVRHGYVEAGTINDWTFQFRFQLDVEGRWKLLAADKEVAAGVVAGFRPGAWHAVWFQIDAARMDLPVLKCGVDGTELYGKPTPAPKTSHITPGVIPMIGSSYDPNVYKAVEIRYDPEMSDKRR